MKIFPQISLVRRIKIPNQHMIQM